MPNLLSNWEENKLKLHEIPSLARLTNAKKSANPRAVIWGTQNSRLCRWTVQQPSLTTWCHRVPVKLHPLANPAILHGSSPRHACNCSSGNTSNLFTKAPSRSSSLEQAQKCWHIPPVENQAATTYTHDRHHKQSEMDGSHRQR